MSSERQELPLGLYEFIKTRKTASLTIPTDAEWQENLLQVDDSQHISSLTRYIASQVSQKLEQTEPQHRVKLVNSLLTGLENELGNDLLYEEEEGKGALTQLTALTPVGVSASPRPHTPLSDVALMTNNPKEPNLAEELQRELESADRVDLLCSFLKLTGVNVLKKQFDLLKLRGIPFRVITTTYMGATDRKAIDQLVHEYGAEVKISYEKNSTRLHVKAWIFHRNSGFTTGYIGSSNLSHAALTEGLEWNVRVSTSVTPGILKQFESTFQGYWESNNFELYSATDGEKKKLDKALAEATTGSGARKRPNLALNFYHVDVHPYPHQSLMLDELNAEREKGHHRNLAVAATGTGKTIFSALDYKRLCKVAGRRLRLLFIAHQAEILEQARKAFSAVMRDATFGEQLYDGQTPQRNEQVFATVQTLSRGAMKRYDPQHFDLIVIDEFHHSVAPSYQQVIEYFNPDELLGLTATPERTDGKNVAAEYFEGRIATQLRLWDALEADLLVPFHYYGIDDGTDLSNIHFVNGKYRENELSEYYFHNKQRLRVILQQIEEKIADPHSMRAIGFCVNIEHAKFMADEFTKAGLPATYLVGNHDSESRSETIRRLKDIEDDLVCIFTVNLFNEGVDIPEVDTLLMLRPTQSPTLFQQQLGRGLRRSSDKAVLVVLDFVGIQAKGFRFDLKMRSFTRNGQITVKDIENPNLPAGCSLQLERKTQEQVIRSIKESLNPRIPILVDQVKVFVEEQKRKNFEVVETQLLQPYLEEYGLALANIYGRETPQKGGLTFTFLLDNAGQIPTIPQLYEKGSVAQKISRRIKALIHVNDQERIDFYTKLLTSDILEADMTLRQKRMAWMLLFSFWPYGKFEKGPEKPKFTMDEGLAELQKYPYFIQEVIQIWALKLDTDRHIPKRSPLLDDSIPLQTHAYYSREEIFAALGCHELENRPSPGSSVGGVLEARQTNTLALTVTLNKSEKQYSPETMYRDYAITDLEFAWDSQNATYPESRLGQIYQHQSSGELPLLFIRYTKTDDIGTAPFLFVGSVSYRSHTGSKPMHIKWKLERRMPAELFNIARSTA